MSDRLVNQNRLIEKFCDLVRIPSPSFQEDGVFELLERDFRRLGLEVHLQAYGKGKNILARLPANAPGYPALILSAHADTVEPCQGIRLVQKDGRISSDGTTILGGDDKAGIAEIIETLEVIKEGGLPHGLLEIVITSAEEVGLVGAKNLDLSWLSAKHCLVLDSSGEIGTIVIEAPSQVSFSLTIRGKKAHAGIEPEKGINAVVAAGHLIRSFPVGRLDGFSVANFGSIAGGGASNIVPDLVTLKGEIRSHRAQRLERRIRRLKTAIARVEKRTRARIELNLIREYQGFAIAPEAPLVNLVKKACEAQGITPKTALSGGGSDANIFIAQGLDSLNLACGMRLAHTNDEFVETQDLVKMTELLLSIISTRGELV